MKQYNDLSAEEKKKLAELDVELYRILAVYEKLTGAKGLFEEVEPFIWDTVDFQALELA